MDIRAYVRKLRNAADSLSELFEVDGTPQIAKKIAKNIKRTMDTIDVTGPVVKRRVSKMKGYKYPPGTHWTHNPKNRARLLRMAKKGAKKRYAKRAK